MKTLLLICLLALPTFAQSPTVELRDSKIIGRKLWLFSIPGSNDFRYQFYGFPGQRPFEGTVKITGGCNITINDTENGHTLTVVANRCTMTGVARLQGFVGGLPVVYELKDTVEATTPKTKDN